MPRLLAFLLTVFISGFSLWGQASIPREAFAELEAAMRYESSDKQLPMLSIILVDENGVVWSGGVGKSELQENLVADADTIYRIGSVSKLFTDIVIMQYVEQGKLDLDTPVVRYLPEFKPENPYSTAITLRHLMSHSSGLVREPPRGNYFDPSESTLADTVSSLNGTTLIYQPGSRVQYSNAAIAVVGRVLEVISGKPFEKIMDEKVLIPMGMLDSSFSPRADVAHRLPEAYMWSYHGVRKLAPTFQLGMAPAGSMFSSMRDLARFITIINSSERSPAGDVLSAKVLQAMWQPQHPRGNLSARSRQYGIGFILEDLDGEFAVSHGGAIYGFSTQLKILPNRQLGVAFATNLDMAEGAISRLADYALGYLLALKDGKETASYPRSAAIPQDQIEALVGRYSDGVNVLEVKVRDNEVYLERVKGLSLRLRRRGNRVVVDDVMADVADVEITSQAITVAGNVYTREKIFLPKAIQAGWRKLLGEYGFDHNILYISEKYGKLHALIEWGMEYPLKEIADNRFQFPDYGLYPNETLNFEIGVAQGPARAVTLNQIRFARRNVGDPEADIFQISPLQPVDKLERAARAAIPPPETGSFFEPDLVDIQGIAENIKLDIRYATEKNFLGTPVYRKGRAFLQKPAAEALRKVAGSLEQLGFGLLVHDAYRPWYVTKIFWDATPEHSKIFVADPNSGSRHNRGCAIDLTLYRLDTGEAVDMVGLYDEMTERSFPYYPGGTSRQRWHRDLLRQAMEAEGFEVYQFEWWHFDYHDWRSYPILNLGFEELD